MKIKFGVNTLVWVLDFSEKELPLLEKIKSMGFDTVELTPGPEYRKIDPENLHKKLDELGLEVSLCGVFNESNDISSDDPAIRQRGIDYMRDFTDWGKKIGARIVGGPLYSAISLPKILVSPVSSQGC